jgi:aspartate/methionine/tyrosine aminotransferase
MAQVQTPVIPLVSQMIAANPGTISLGQGMVHYGPPREVIERVQQMAGDPSVHRYHLVDGIDPLLEAIEGKLQTDNGIALDDQRDDPLGDQQRIVVTAGANMGFLNAIMAVANLGDQIIIQSPFYFNHAMAIGMIGCKAIVVPTDGSYQLNVGAIQRAITDRTRAVVTISPNNPTGTVYAPESLRGVNALCKSRGLFHISDEAYEYFTYDGIEHFSPASIPDAAAHTISLFSLSKAYGMAGWRLGYMLIPAQLEDAVRKIQDTNLICPPIICQRAGLAAMQVGPSYCQPKIAELQAVRDLVLEQLRQLGDRIEVPHPQGAFYVMARLHRSSENQIDDLQLVRKLVEQFGVAVMPGSTFGSTDPCSIRIAYGALEKDTVAQATERLVKGLSQLL